MCLAMVGMAVMPVVTVRPNIHSSEIYAALKYAKVIKGNKYADALGLTSRVVVNLLKSLVGN